MNVLALYNTAGTLMLSAPIKWDEDHDTNGLELPDKAVERLRNHVAATLNTRARDMTHAADLPHRSDFTGKLEAVKAIFRPERPKALWQAPPNN